MNEEDQDNGSTTVRRITVNEDTFDRSLRDLARLTAEINDLEAQTKELNARKEELSYATAQYMLTTGCSKKVLDGITFTQKQKVYSKVEDKEALRAWIMENDAVDILMTVHPSKLTAYCNEQLENGGTTPTGVNPNFIKYSVHVKQ